MKQILLLLFMIIFGTGCGLFTPADPEYPSGPLNADPFSFKDILDNKNEDEFYFDFYEDVFNSKFNYSDVVSSSSKYDKSGFLARLKVVDDDSIRVNWSRNDSTQKDPSLLDYENDIDLTLRNYEITVRDSVVDLVEYSTVYTGEAIFTLRYDSKKKWQILNWEDKNTTSDKPGKSYFNPEFLKP